MILLCMTTFAFNAQAESDFVDKIKSVSIEGVTVTEIKNIDKQVMIIGTAKDNKIISRYLRALDSEIGSPNLEYIKKDKQGGAMSDFAISIKKLKK
jgi:type IV pilus assembly PilN-like protein